MKIKCSLHRVLTDPSIFTSCRDHPSYLASTKTVCNLLLPPVTAMHDKQLPAETACVVMLPAENLYRKQSHVDSLRGDGIVADSSLGRKHEFTDNLRQSLQKPSMTNSLNRKQNLEDKFILCVIIKVLVLFCTDQKKRCYNYK